MNMQTLEEYAFLENILNGDKNTITEIKNDEDLDKTKTKQENDRDKHITKLLEFYVENYGIKIKQNKFYKNVLFYVCIVILSLAFLGIGFLIFYITKYTEIKPEGLATIISSLVSFLILIIGLLKIITTYVFPQKDEEHIANLVKLIQTNDLKSYMLRQNDENIKNELENELNGNTKCDKNKASTNK